MTEIDDWLEAQVRRERRVVRLEDALLAGHYGRYFLYRLRFFIARTFVSAVIHAIRIVLLLGAFAVSEFLFYILLSATAALVADAWWGALESMRSRIRHLQRSGSRFRIAAEIAGWLRLSVLLCAVGCVAAAALFIGGLALQGDLSPILVMSVAVVVGSAVNLVVRAYHSGAYAMRRVYRPLPSLLATDIISLVALLALWPVVGIWAFPIAEVLALLSLVSISFWYTARTYRSLALPTFLTLLQERAPLPSRRSLRAAVAPGVSYGLVGLESLVMVTVMLQASTESTAQLVALLAALSPVIRAGFEWARLLYFDMARLDVPLLWGLRRQFDRAVARLSIVIGGLTWLFAALVAAFILGIRDPAILVALLAFFVARSVLAAAQMRAFTWRAYGRLAITGIAAVFGFLVALLLFDTAAGRLLGLAVALGLAAAALVAMPERRPREEQVAAPADWLERLREIGAPVTVYGLEFDRGVNGRRQTREERRTASWRRRRVGQRLGREVARNGGLTTWMSEHRLSWFLPDGARSGATRSVRRSVLRSGGLVTDVSPPSHYPDGASAAGAIGGSKAVDAVPDPAAVEDAFRRRFQDGLVYDVAAPDAAVLEPLDSRARASLLRAAIQFVRERDPGPSPLPYEVSALAVGGSLRLLFLVDRRERPEDRRAWRTSLTAWNRALAATGPQPVPSRSARASMAG